MNQAMLAKQFWRIHQNTQSLLARTFKAKYFPRSSIHECQPKPHQSWFWRNIVKLDNRKLKEGKWWVGNGTNIPLDHPAWFQTPNLHNSNLIIGIVADLIDHANHSWKPGLVRSLYPPSISSEILCIPISKPGSVTNSLMWKFSNSGDFNVKKAYEILLEEANVSANANLRPHIILDVVWNTLWKVRLPLKIYNLV